MSQNSMETMFSLSRADEKIKSKVQNGVPMKVKTKSDILLFVDQAKPNKAISFYMRSEGGYFRCKRGLNE